MKVDAILNQIDVGSIALPEFQRGYVWNRDQVRGLMQSLYRGHPVGSLLVWETPTEGANARGDQDLHPGFVRLLLDGQQRVTSLYGLVRGEAPPFFEGNDRAFSDLRFHLSEEVFSFYQPLKMKDDPLWIDVTELLQKGAGVVLHRFLGKPEYSERIDEFLTRLNQIDQIKNVELHIEEVTGKDKSIDVVVDIFNRVNSGGTKLSKGDLALAKICAEWSEARQSLNKELHRWSSAGYEFKLELLLRSVTTTLTGEAMFSVLDGVESKDFQEGLKTTVKHIDKLLNLIGSRLGLDHDRVLGGRYALPLMSRYLENRGGSITDPNERDKLLYWYVHSFLWGRYAGSTETVLNQDLDAIEDIEHGIDKLIANLRQDRGELFLGPQDFLGWSRSARFYPLLYMLTRAWGALDWESGVELKGHLLGNFSNLELHHIFPKARLYEAGFERPQVNALANFTFLTKETNLKVLDKEPITYLTAYANKDPELITSHWIPLEPELWRIDRYEDFLTARRELLANAANDFLETLSHGNVPEEVQDVRVVDREVGSTPIGFDGEEERLLIELNDWVSAQGLPKGELMLELSDSITGATCAVLDLAWPDGIQVGLSAPVAVLLDEPVRTEVEANRAGYRFFTDVESFRNYVEREVLAIEDAA